MSLDRFIRAQENVHGGFDEALAEIRGGAKRGHWIWYVFPQLAGLGESHMSRTYALCDLDEAVAYLRDPVLAPRLLSITRALLDQLEHGRTLTTVMGSRIDALKVVSSLTLFERAAGDDALAAVARDVLNVAEGEGYPRCRFTLERVGAAGSTPPAGAPPTSPPAR
jgi:uncharacterized protein (DUF1810 family)